MALASEGQLSIFPGVKPGAGRAETLHEAVTLATEAAERAGRAGSFGVGGLLLGPQLEVLAISENHVIHQGKLCDPTAHGERQLLDWYYANRRQLPPSEELTVVSSLDPCMMCAGSILSAKMKVLSLTLDTMNGVNFDGEGDFGSLPRPLNRLAASTFAYLGIEGLRPYQGFDPFPFAETTVSRAAEERSKEAFWQGMSKIKELVNQDQQPLNIQESPAALAYLRDFWNEAACLTCDPDRPGAELAPHLVGDTALLLDPFGNLLLKVESQSELSPLRTPFMELTRAWSRVRAQAKVEDLPYLPHLKRCRIVTTYGPGRKAHHVMELGALGSSVEGLFPQGSRRHWQYAIPRQHPDELAAMLEAFPPYYRHTLAPDIVLVEDPALRRAVSERVRTEASDT